MNQRSFSDAELVQGVRDGNQASGDDLFAKYSRRVYYLALRELRSHADAEDVRAETFLRVLTAIQAERVRSPERLSSFILSTANNIILETLRARGRSATGQELLDVAAPEPHPMLDEEVHLAIESAIGRLKPREREFLRLHYYEELPRDEIARRIGIEEEQTRLIKSRALKSFRELYQRFRKIADTKGGRPSHKV